MNFVGAKCFVFIGFLLAHLSTEAVRVGPCPTNKVAGRQLQGRTFGHFVQLFSDDDQGGSPERPQHDDCDDIEDYDDTDLSSITNQNQYQPNSENRLFFNLFNGNNFWKPPNSQYPQPPRPEVPVRPQRPEVPMRPQGDRPTLAPRPPKRPPPGGYLSGNQYSPPHVAYPSDQVKPVYEANFDIPAPYRPTIVGGPVNQIVGVATQRPPNRPSTVPPCYHYTPRPTTRLPTRTGRLSNTVIGSYIDLFFN